MAGVKQVYIIPGVFGSELYRFDLIGRGERLWLDYLQLLYDGPTILQLDGDTGKPIDGSKQGVQAGGVLTDYYGMLLVQLRKTLKATYWPYDWRYSVLDAGKDLAKAIRFADAAGSVGIVAHSMGGLVALAAYRLLSATGDADRIGRIVTLGTPFLGSWVPAFTWVRHAELYDRLTQLIALSGRGLDYGYSEELLDQTIASWPGFYELLTHKLAIPAAGGVDISDLVYAPLPYRKGNGYLRQDMFSFADAAHNTLDIVDIDGLHMVCIAGVGQTTPSGIGFTSGKVDAYAPKYSNQGDGTVLVSSAVARGKVQGAVAATHDLLPQDPRVLNRIVALLTGTMPTSDFIL